MNELTEYQLIADYFAHLPPARSSKLRHADGSVLDEKFAIYDAATRRIGFVSTGFPPVEDENIVPAARSLTYRRLSDVHVFEQIYLTFELNWLRAHRA